MRRSDRGHLWDRAVQVVGLAALIAIALVWWLGTSHDRAQDHQARDAAAQAQQTARVAKKTSCATVRFSGDLVRYFATSRSRLLARIGTSKEASTDRAALAQIDRLLDTATTFRKGLQGTCGDVVPRTAPARKPVARPSPGPTSDAAAARRATPIAAPAVTRPPASRPSTTSPVPAGAPEPVRHDPSHTPVPAPTGPGRPPAALPPAPASAPAPAPSSAPPPAAAGVVPAVVGALPIVGSLPIVPQVIGALPLP